MTSSTPSLRLRGRNKEEDNPFAYVYEEIRVFLRANNDILYIRILIVALLKRILVKNKERTMPHKVCDLCMLGAVRDCS